MKQVLAQSWWVLALRGACALIFGVLALAWPGVTLLLLVALFAAYAIISGVAALVGSLRTRNQRGWWLLFLLGLVSVAAGVLAVVYPGITALALVLLMGANAIVIGALEIWMAVRLRAEVRGEWLLGLAGFVSILFGVFVMIFPGAGALALVWLIAVQAIVSGLLWLTLAFRIRSAAAPDTRHKTHGVRPA
jgi:uncharacterized membrane protein HdeD (DUF308 family)